MAITQLGVGKYKVEVDGETKKVIFNDLGARGVITEVESLWDNAIFWLGAIGYCIEDLALGPDNIARLTSEEFPDLAIKTRLNAHANTHCDAYARHVDHNTHYWVYLYYGAATADHVMGKKVNGTYTTLATEAVDLGTYYWYWTIFEAVGSTLNSYRASTPYVEPPASPTLTATDTDISTGRWGVRHWGVGPRGLHGLFLFFIKPPSLGTEPPRKPLTYLEVPVEGEGEIDKPFKPRLPMALEEIPPQIIDERNFNTLKSTLGKFMAEKDVVELGRALGYVSVKTHINKLAFTWSALIPTPKGQLVDSTCILRVFDVKGNQGIDKVIEAFKELGAKKLSRDEALKRAKQLDDRLHDFDLEPARPRDESEEEKLAKEYQSWRESQFKVHTSLELVKRYIKAEKGW